MKKFLIVLIISLISCDLDFDTMMFTKFQKFIKKYNKKYNSVNQFLARFEIFKRNVVATFQENSSYKTGITKFSDLTQQEFTKTYLNLNYDALAIANFNPYKVKKSNIAPDSFDWRNRGLVTPVRDQGACGSCWAFSTVANLEGLYYKNKGKLLDLSEQILVDCDTLDSGCNGGLMEYAFKWLVENGMETEEDYPILEQKEHAKRIHLNTLI